MEIGTAFEDFVKELQDIDMEDKKKRMKRITRKMNKTYYDGNESEKEHFLQIGSLGRHTAIKSVSDVDIGFVLPQEIYVKYNSRKNNGQSDLLQDVKKTLLELAPRTIVRGDGQVVVLEYSDYVVELCPYFYNDEDSYVYPNSNNNGKWQITKPIPEIKKSEDMINETNGNFQNVCNILRAWRNEQGFKFGGLLIDTLVNKFFSANEDYFKASFSDYPQLLKDLFKYLKNLNESQEYWYALGSQQKVYNKNNKFVAKAEKAYSIIEGIDNTSSEMHKKMRELFGNYFPNDVKTQNNKNVLKTSDFNKTEEFISDSYKIDIRYSMEIKCEVSQDGWRDKTPLRLISFLKSDKNLEFEAKISQDIEEPYDIKWKVLNVGTVARDKNQIRGQIIDKEDKKQIHSEITKFKGPHYVEAYVIKNNVVIAKDRIDVPIGAQ